MNLAILLSSLLVLLNIASAEQQSLILATTTSTDNSGLLQTILPDFEERYGVDVDVIAVGTGAALRLGANGDADVVLVHAPSAERVYIEEGAYVNWRYLMYNDFVLLGPSSDPAAIANSSSVAEALNAIAVSDLSFISRGDDSGTHKKELALWQAANVSPPSNYLEIGQGMGAALLMASETQAYVLSDRGTYLSMRGQLELSVLYAGDDAMFNPYHIMAVNPNEHPGVNYMAAMMLIAYLSTPEVQERIGNFTIADEVLFFPAANTIPFE